MKKEPAMDVNVVAQIGFIVKDIEKTNKAFANFFGMDAPEIAWTGEFKDTQQHYKGKPVGSRAKQSFFEMKNIELELIEPDEEPSIWRDHLESHGEGIHHIAFVVDNVKQTVSNLDNLDFSLIQEGEYEGGRYAYVDTFHELKMILELIEKV